MNPLHEKEPTEKRLLEIREILEALAPTADINLRLLPPKSEAEGATMWDKKRMVMELASPRQTQLCDELGYDDRARRIYTQTIIYSKMDSGDRADTHYLLELYRPDFQAMQSRIKLEELPSFKRLEQMLETIVKDQTKREMNEYAKLQILVEKKRAMDAWKDSNEDAAWRLQGNVFVKATARGEGITLYVGHIHRRFQNKEMSAKELDAIEAYHLWEGSPTEVQSADLAQEYATALYEVDKIRTRILEAR